MVGSVLAPECVILMPDPGQLFGLGDKSALITGAGSGIGQAIAATLRLGVPAFMSSISIQGRPGIRWME